MMYMVKVEVIYCDPERQWIIPVALSYPSTVRQAIIQSNILSQDPHLELEKLTVGIFSQRVTLDTCLSSGDRVEIYRPLLIDPKQARRKRSLKN